jgi:hypothetical protein
LLPGRVKDFAQRGFAAIKENQKAKGKNQKAKISAPGRGPDWGRIFRGWPQSKQSSMSQSSMSHFLSGAGGRLDLLSELDLQCSCSDMRTNRIPKPLLEPAGAGMSTRR